MGCVSSVFQFGSYLVNEGPEASAEQKEDTPVAEQRSEEESSSPTPQVTSPYHSPEELRPSSGTSSQYEAASSEQTTKSKEEEVKQTEAEKKEAKPSEASEKELERVQETKLEKEKTVDSSGTTTEKTVYTQYTESTKIHDSKGERPAFEPFDSASQTTVFPQFTEIKIPPSPREEEKISTSSSPKSTYVHNVEIQTPSEAEKFPSKTSSPDEEKAEDVDYNRSEVADAVVKIQAGVRGYLTRKSLKGNKRHDQSSDEQTANGVSEEVSPQSEVVAEEEVASPEDDEDAEVSSEDTGEENAAVKIQALYRGYRTRKHLDGIKSEPLDHPPSKVFSDVESPKSSVLLASYPSDVEEIHAESEKSSSVKFDEESVANEGEVVSEEEKGHEQAATKIQAAFRGYKVRKDFKQGNDPDAENFALESSTEDKEPMQTVEEVISVTEAKDDIAEDNEEREDLLSSLSDAGSALQNKVRDATYAGQSLCSTVETQPEQHEPDVGLLVDISQSPERDHVPSDPEEDVEEQEDSGREILGNAVDVVDVQWQTSEIYVQDSNESGATEKTVPEESIAAANPVNSIQFSTTTTLLLEGTHPQQGSSDIVEPQQEEMSVPSVVKDTQGTGSEQHKAQ